jgi:outer membrane protein TolC
MTRIEEAARRLERAVERLEAASRAVQNKCRAGQANLVEVQRLSSALATAKTEYAALSSVTDTVAARLDGAINRLNAVLGD